MCAFFQIETDLEKDFDIYRRERYGELLWFSLSWQPSSTQSLSYSRKEKIKKKPPRLKDQDKGQEGLTHQL